MARDVLDRLIHNTANRSLISRRALLASGVTLTSGAAYGQVAGIVPAETRPDASIRFGFGWVRDLPDLADQSAVGGPQPSGPLPTTVDLSGAFPPALDQGAMGSCTAHAIASAVRYARTKAGYQTGRMALSRLFIYYNERKIEGTIVLDRGAQIRNGIRSIVESGVCSERSWPYEDIAGDRITKVFPPGSRAVQEPPESVKEEALQFRAISYSQLPQNEASLKSCIAAGFPFIFGFRVYSNLIVNGTPSTIVNLPGISDHAEPYGHAVLAVGYDDSRQLFKILNSWGPGVQERGYFYMHYDYVLNRNLSADFWVVQLTQSLIRPQ